MLHLSVGVVGDGVSCGEGVLGLTVIFWFQHLVIYLHIIRWVAEAGAAFKFRF